MARFAPLAGWFLPPWIVVSLIAAAAADPDDCSRDSVLRQPVGLVANPGRVFVANGRSGTISTVSSATGQVTFETAIASRLSDLAAGPQPGDLLATDPERGELVLLQAEGDSVAVKGRLTIPGKPVTVCVSSRQSLCSVASLWARRITLVEFNLTPDGPSETRSLRAVARIDLPIAPREQCLIDDDARLVVADSFAGQFAIIDLGSRRLESLHVVEGHNIRGLLWDDSSESLLISQQLLDERLPTTESHVSWGGIVSNVVRTVPLAELLRSPNQSTGGAGPVARVNPHRVSRWNLAPVGVTDRAAADPGRMLQLDPDRLVVALGGVGEIAIRYGKSDPFNALPAGERPVALALDQAGDRLFSASAFDDTVSVWRASSMSPIGKISLGPRPALTATDRGERLFYDGRLAHRRWYSCHSCHTDGHTNGLLNDNLGDGGYGSPRRIPTLLGTAETSPWAWNGRQMSLEDQVRSSLLTTMHGGAQVASRQHVDDLVAYLQTLPPAPGLGTARGDLDLSSVARGRAIFEERDCVRCHVPPTYTSPRVYDVGLHDGVSGKSESFNPPSLLGVSQRGPYFHDSRARTLRDLFEGWDHGETSDLSRESLADLLEFLRSL